MTLQIGLLLFPGVQQLDLTGPYEIFASLPDTVVHLVARTPEIVTSVTGLQLVPTTTYAACRRRHRRRHGFRLERDDPRRNHA